MTVEQGEAHVGMPSDIGIIDTMIGFPMRDTEAVYEFIKKQTKDADSKQSAFPAEYMFKQAPKQHDSDDDPVDITLREMDKFGVERGLIGVHNDEGKRALKEHPDRFIPSMSADPNDGVDGLRRITANYEEFGIRAVGVFPCAVQPASSGTSTTKTLSSSLHDTTNSYLWANTISRRRCEGVGRVAQLRNSGSPKDMMAAARPLLEAEMPE